MSTIVCDTATHLQQTFYRSYAALEPVLSGWRTSSRYASNASVSYVSATTGSYWNSSGDLICMIPPKRSWIIRPGGPPKPGATARLVGTLRDAFPELKELSEEDLDRLLQRMRR